MISEERIKELVSLGKLNPDQGLQALSLIRPSEIMVHQPQRINPLGIAVQAIGRGVSETFNHNNALEHYEKRMDLEEGFRHILGLPVYGLIAGIDAILDAVGFGISEIAEDITFTTGRIIYKSKDGWERSKIR
jgi:hypothetical protein